MKTPLTLSLLSLAMATTASAATISWNTQGQATDVPNGILSLDELTSATSHTYVDVAGAGFDIRVSGSSTMALSTGDLNYTVPGSSIKFEFFATGTTNPVALDGFAIDWLDLDGGETMGTFTIVDAGGTPVTLDTSSPFFDLGAAVGTADVDGGNGITPDAISGTVSSNWNNFGSSFVTDFTGTPIRSFSIDTTSGFVAPTSLTLPGGGAEITGGGGAIPEPSRAILGLLGAVGVLLRRRRRKGNASS